MKSDKGMGIIPLIITIIVLLMIAAVAISMLVGEDEKTSGRQNVVTNEIENTTNENINNTY